MPLETASMHTGWDAHVVLLWWECFPRPAALAVCVTAACVFDLACAGRAFGCRCTVVESSGREREDTYGLLICTHATLP